MTVDDLRARPRSLTGARPSHRSSRTGSHRGREDSCWVPMAEGVVAQPCSRRTTYTIELPASTASSSRRSPEHGVGRCG